MIFSNLARAGLNITTKRFMRKKANPKSWPNDWVPFHWSRPEKVPGYFDGTDLIDLGEPKYDELLPGVGASDQLKKLKSDDPLRKIFSLDNAKKSQYNKALVHQHIKELGLIHEIDHSNSLEAKIINLTYTFRQLIEKINKTGETNRYTGHVRTYANSVKYRRYRYLCELKELHGDRYERLVRALRIEPKNNPINVPSQKPYRKVQMRRLASEYSRDLKEKKVEEFMLSLKKEQLEFEKEKKETMKWIEEQEKQLGFIV